MNIKDIKDEIVSTLTNYAGLTALGIKAVYEGNREQVSMDNYPCLMVEIFKNDEVRNDTNTKVDLIATFGIGGFKKIEDVDSQLDDIMELEKQIKKAISQDVTLNGNSIDLNVIESVYDTDLWPIRAVIVTVQVHYRQTFTDRT